MEAVGRDVPGRSAQYEMTVQVYIYTFRYIPTHAAIPHLFVN